MIVKSLLRFVASSSIARRGEERTASQHLRSVSKWKLSSRNNYTNKVITIAIAAHPQLSSSRRIKIVGHKGYETKLFRLNSFIVWIKTISGNLSCSLQVAPPYFSICSSTQNHKKVSFWNMFIFSDTDAKCGQVFPVRKVDFMAAVAIWAYLHIAELIRICSKVLELLWVDKDTLHHAPVGIQLENYAFSILTWPDGLRAAIHGHFDVLTKNQEGLVIKGLHQNEFNQKSKSWYFWTRTFSPSYAWTFCTLGLIGLLSQPKMDINCNNNEQRHWSRRQVWLSNQGSGASLSYKYLRCFTRDNEALYCGQFPGEPLNKHPCS